VSPSFLPRARNVEYLLKLATKHRVEEQQKNNSDSIRSTTTNNREVGEGTRKHFQYIAEKISTWARENKVRFNDKKSKTILMAQRKRK